jgi:putative ABC transport system ATP-binding protein
VIELKGVTREYEVGGHPVHALCGIDLHIQAGEYVSVMGPSGSGKSTLLHILGCLDRPTAGTFLLDGEDVGTLPDESLARIRQRKIGFVFQAFHLVPRLSAAENVELPMIFASMPKSERSERVSKALHEVGLEGRSDHRPDQLSGGERQRVAIARSVVMGPSILLADEPTGNLDAKSGKEVMGLLEGMNTSGLTLVVVTHDPVIGGKARRRIRLQDGAIAEDA